MRLLPAFVLFGLLLEATPTPLWADEPEPKPSPQRTAAERAVDKALDQLAKTQHANGSWVIGQGRGKDEDGSTAVTSLVVLAFLSAGHVPGEGEYGAPLTRAVEWVVARQDDAGVFGTGELGELYHHGIATLMLAEVAHVLNEERGRTVRAALDRAVKPILRAQNVEKEERHRGGWRYQVSSRDSDLSVSVWQLLALRSAKDAGIDVPDDNLHRAVDYVRRCAAESGGFTYQPGIPADIGVSTTRSGMGILALEATGDHRAAASTRAGERMPDAPLRWNDSWFFYGAFFASAGAFRLGGEPWEGVRKNVHGVLLDWQEAEGIWKPNGAESRGGIAYATSLAVMALSVETKKLTFLRPRPGPSDAERP